MIDDIEGVISDIDAGVANHVSVATLRRAQGEIKLLRKARFWARVVADHLHTTPGGDACEFEERLGPRAAMGEEVMLRLRLAEGLSLSALSERWGCPSRDVFSVLLDRFSNAGLLAWPGRGDRIALTERGLELADSVLAEFLAVPV